jgi:hypothetical protein
MISGSAILTHRLSYQTQVVNTATSPLTNIRVLLAFPPPFEPYQQLLEIKPSPNMSRQASDKEGNNWLNIACPHLAGNDTFTCGYTALIRNRSIHYQPSPDIQNHAIPNQLQPYIEPEYFIESHHHLIKDLARDLAKKHRKRIPFIKAAMRAVTKTLRYVPQEHERGAAYAIEQQVGDCTEYSALFAAICRARKIPARLISGFAASKKKWERHGWSEVWIRKQWVPVDPTWFGSNGWLGITNQHIPLIIGNWMDIRTNREFKASWRQQPHTSPPRLSSTWKVRQVVGFQAF